MSNKFHVRVLGGSCGPRMVIVAEHLEEVFRQMNYNCKVSHISIWETFSFPPTADLLLQLLPAFSQDEADCPIINIRPLLADINDASVMQQIFTVLDQKCPAVTPA